MQIQGGPWARLSEEENAINLELTRSQRSVVWRLCSARLWSR